MRIFYIWLMLFLWVSAFGQTKSIKVYFLYGSKPAKGFEKIEKRRFGGINGGHVSIGVDEEIIGFGPKGKLHIFPEKNKHHSKFITESLASFIKDTVGDKYTVITIPVTNDQYKKLKDIHNGYCSAPPYDYAFMGMRCAAASYDILSQIGLLKPKGKAAIATRYFYPRRLRHRMLREAKEKGYKVNQQPGRQSRKWERD
jgi:hypothetical protein